MGLFSKSKPKKAGATAGPAAKPKARPEEHFAFYNCITSDYKLLNASPLALGSDPNSDIILGGPLMAGVRLKLQCGMGKCLLAVEGGNPDITVDGSTFEGGFLGDGSDEHTLQIGSSYFFLIKRGDPTQLQSWKDSVSKARWFLTSWQNLAAYEAFQTSEQRHAENKTKGRATAEQQLKNWSDHSGPLDFRSMVQLINSKSWGNEIALVNLQGSEVAFHVEQMKDFASPQVDGPREGAQRCPRCGERFEVEDMLAVHPTRYGDDVLLEGELQRFKPSRIGADGRALDENGRPCSDWACPYCRGKLPQGFHDSPVHALSIVGDSMAGKSYYLSIAIRQLKRNLYQQFGINFTDADAPENAALNDMITTLFTAATPGEAILKKTELAGATYKTLTRNGERVSLPQPFAYRAFHKDSGAATFVVYDNAGEHFRPDVPESEKAALTEHMAWSSAALFLFDPVQQIDMLRTMSAGKDPQIERVRSERLRCDQDVILSEIGGRIRDWKGLRADEQPNIPLAMVIGKHDLWEALLPRSELQVNLCENGKLNGAAILHNSTQTRKLLMSYCPEIVAAAEAISCNVRYFPVSAFGCPAVKIRDGASQIHYRIGPDPNKLHPFLVEAPFLWAISQIAPRMLPNS